MLKSKPLVCKDRSPILIMLSKQSNAIPITYLYGEGHTPAIGAANALYTIDLSELAAFSTVELPKWLDSNYWSGVKVQSHECDDSLTHEDDGLFKRSDVLNEILTFLNNLELPDGPFTHDISRTSRWFQSQIFIKSQLGSYLLIWKNSNA
jgi:hypothetical protein